MIVWQALSTAMQNLKKILLDAGKIFRGRSTAQKDMHVELLTYIT